MITLSMLGYMLAKDILCNTETSSDIRFKLKSRKVSSVTDNVTTDHFFRFAMKHGSVATVLCVNLAMIGKSRSNLWIKSFLFFLFRTYFYFLTGPRLYTPIYFGSAWLDMLDLGNISNYVNFYLAISLF